MLLSISGKSKSSRLRYRFIHKEIRILWFKSISDPEKQHELNHILYLLPFMLLTISFPKFSMLCVSNSFFYVFRRTYLILYFLSLTSASEMVWIFSILSLRNYCLSWFSFGLISLTENLLILFTYSSFFIVFFFFFEDIETLKTAGNVLFLCEALLSFLSSLCILNYSLCG